MDKKTQALFKECIRDLSHYKLLTLARFCSIPARLLSMHVLPIAGAALVDAAANGNLDERWRLLLALVFISEIVRFFLVLTFTKADAKLNHYTRPKREARNMARVMRLPYQTILDKSSGQLAAQANNKSQYIQKFMEYVTQSLETIIVSLVAVVIIYSQSRIFAAAYLSVLTIGVLYLGYLARKRVSINKKSNEAWEKLNGEFNDVVQNSQNVITNHTFKQEFGRHEQVATKYWQDGMIRWYYAVFQGNSIRLFSLLVTGVYLSLGVYLLLNEQIGIGAFVLFQSYIGMTLTNVDTVVQLIRNFSEETTKALSLDYTEEKSPYLVEPDKPKKAKDNSLSFESVSFTYDDNETSALSGVNLVVKPGESVGVVGKSGSGKTTVTKLILRFYDPSSGVIKIGGQSLQDIGTKGVRSLVSYVPQDPILFHRSIKENIAYAVDKKVSDKKLQLALEQSFLNEFIDGLPEGIDTIVGDRGIKLSGGQRQRVAIARAIVKDAPILIFDEATSALDSESESIIQKALTTVMKDKTAVVVAHRLSTLKHMDRIVVMDEGKIIEDGTHAELIKKDGAYSRLWDHQSNGFIE